MGLRDLVMGRPACAAPGSSSSSSSNPLRSFADAFIGYSPKSEELSTSAVLLKASFDLFKVVPLSTVPGDENEIELDQGSTRSIKGADFVNGHHGDACGDNFQTSILSVPELRGIGPDLQELEQIDRATSMNFNPKFGPQEMGLPELLRQSPFQPNNVLAHQPGEHLQGLVSLVSYLYASYDIEMRWPRMISHPQVDEFWNQPPTTVYELQKRCTEVLPHSFEQQHGADSWLSEFEQGIDRLDISTDELPGSWLSFLRIALSHLGGLSQPRFFDESIKWHEQVIKHRVGIEMEGLQQRSGWSVKIEETRGSLFNALQDAAMLAVITMRLHFPVEFRGTPFTVLPMAPGQRTRLDYPVVGGSGVAAAFMGITNVDVATLQREHFTSFQCERWEYFEALKEHTLRRGKLLAVARKMMEEIPLTPEKMIRGGFWTPPSQDSQALLVAQ
ncbi:hypothetical protein ACQ4PT_032385 [Festuca glaucescens]